MTDQQKEPPFERLPSLALRSAGDLALRSAGDLALRSAGDLARSPRAAPLSPIERLARENPHCRQVLTRAIAPYFAGEGEADLRPLESLPVLMGPDAPRLKFFDRPDKERSPLHFGQLKLFMSELAFLLRSTDACTGAPWAVVYAGAAPGHHIPYLASLFPSCLFLLYDPSPFCAALDDPPQNVRVFKDTFFTETVAAGLAEEYADACVAFVCDIRTGKEERYVKADMDRQEGWIHTLKPAVSMVKFRLPWAGGSTPYLAGDVMRPAFAPLTSTECRLITTREEAEGPPHDYDHTEYEERCAHHNCVARVRGYKHGVSVPGLDHCHDCSALVQLAGDYLSATGEDASDASVATFIKATIAAFGTGRTLATEYARSSNRSAKKRPKLDFTNDTLRVVDGGAAPRAQRGSGRAQRGSGRAPRGSGRAPRGSGRGGRPGGRRGGHADSGRADAGADAGEA